ncbi:MAG: PKD domain-containing protein [Bacteroidia bacterium]|nr:PKD domain-containing protein [Bacteroidia bacterium]
MKTFLYLIPLAALLLFSCRKKDFPETIPDLQSDFYFNGTVEGVPVSLKAGLSGYYMYSSHAKDSATSLYHYVATLKSSDCNTCLNSLQVIIHDPRSASQIDKPWIDSLLPQSYPIQGAPYYAVHFKSLFNKQAAAYTWEFGDKSYSNQANPVHIYKTPGHYRVRLKIDSDNGCQQYVANMENIKYPMLRPNISTVQSSANVINFATSFSDSSSYSHHWDFGDGSTSTSPYPSHGYNIPGTYPVILRTVSPKQDTLYTKYNVATQTTPMPCITNYEVVSLERVPNPEWFSKIIINWTDEQGLVYTSNNFSQPAESYFKIISVEDYQTNEKGEKTKKIHLNFSCKVYNGNHVKTIKDADAVLSISYR